MEQPEIKIGLSVPAAREAPAAPSSAVAERVEGARFQFDPPAPGLLLWAMALLMLLSARRAYMRTTRAVKPELRLVLAALRVAAFGVVLFCLARPVLVEQRQLREPSRCFVAVDNSSSMDLRDAGGGRTRWQVAGEIIAAHKSELAKLDAACDLHRYLFDSSPRRLARLPGEPGASVEGPRGITTDIAALLEKFSAEAGAMSAAGAMIISDGRHNSPKDVLPAALALQRAGVPLFVIGLGQEATPAAYKDIRIRELNVPEKAFIGSRMVLRVEIESTLLDTAVVPLTVEIGGKKVHDGKVVLPPGTRAHAPAVEITYVPDTLGIHRVTAALGSLEGEADTANNTRGAFFRVYRSRLGIWYVEGAIRKEYGALCSALATAPNVKLEALNAFMARTASPEELLPTEQALREQIKLVIIGDLPASRFEVNGLRALARFVEQGGAMLMIGGASNMGAGLWQRSPLAPVLPVEMSADDGVHNGPLRIEVPATAASHPIVMLGETPEQSAEIWKQLPPLPGINRARELRPAAQVLLRAGIGELLIVQEYGKGRSAVFTGDTTWQWILKAGQSDAHKRFWRNLVTWLTRSDYRDTEKAVFADAERLQLQVGEEAAFRAHVHETERTAAIKDARVALTLSRVQDEIESSIFSEDAGKGPGEYARPFTPGAPGSYRFRASAIAPDGRVIDSDSVDIQVSAPDVEHDNPKANLSLLRRIAELSGGQYYDPERAGDAFQALLRGQAAYTRTVTETTELWNRPWVLALFIALLAMEWGLRRRWGLV